MSSISAIDKPPASVFFRPSEMLYHPGPPVYLLWLYIAPQSPPYLLDNLTFNPNPF
jgi:hypothetical protein